MGNTITNILPILYEAADIVSRELTGFIPSVFRNSSAERAAVGETITYPIVPPATTGDIVPATTAPNDGDVVVGAGTMTISKSKYSPVRWAGEEIKGASNSNMYALVLRQQFEQALRTLVNLVEADVFAAGYKAASRGVGTAGTTPFGTAGDLSDSAGVLRILEDNGAPTGDLHLVFGSATMANLRGKQNVLFKVNEAGTDELLRQGTIGRLQGLNLHNSAAVQQVTKGTGASYVVNNAPGYVAGNTSIVLGTGTGTVLAGDMVTFAGDTNKYGVGTGIAAPGTLVLNQNGLRQSLANTVAMTVGGNYTPNIAFARSAIHLITRAPAMPPQGDMAIDVTEIVDPQSGLAFQVAMYKEYRRVRYEVGLAWGTQAVKSEHIATLIG